MKNILMFRGAGISLMVFPFLGLPSSWESFLIALIGLWIVALSFLSRKVHKPAKRRAELSGRKPSDMNRQTEVLIENKADISNVEIADIPSLKEDAHIPKI